MHLLPWGSPAFWILWHLLAYLYEAAHAWKKDRAAAVANRASTCGRPVPQVGRDDGGAFHVVSLSADELLVYLANLMDSKN